MSRVFNIATWVNRLSKAYPITRNSLSNTSNSIPNSWRILKSLALSISMAHFTRRSFGNIYLKSLIANASTAAQKMYPLKKSIFFREPKAERIEPITSPFRAVRVILKRETDIPTRWTGQLGKRVPAGTSPREKTAERRTSRQHNSLEDCRDLESHRLTRHFRHWRQKQSGIANKQGSQRTHYYDAACVAGVAKSSTSHSVLAIRAVGYGHRGDLGDYQTKQKAPGFKSSYTRIEHSGGFQKLDTVEMTN